jgi:glycosyltransferase involved in cell wall biosynthesis
VAPDEVARLGIGDRVTIVGRVGDDELAAWYRRAQMLVSPSLYEGFGLPAAEAMASGTPVIATDAGALPEVVADGEAGAIVPATDAASLAESIASLLDDRERCARLGAAGIERVHDRFTWSHHARGLEALYADVLAEHRK